MSGGKAITHQLFSTKQFVPGHIVGTLILVFGTIGLAKFFMGRWEAAEAETLSRQKPNPFVGGWRSNARGQYG